MYYKLSLVAPFVVITLLGRPIQAFICLILILSSIFSFAFIDVEQGLALYLTGVFHSMLLVYVEHRSKLAKKFNQLVDKIINE